MSILLAGVLEEHGIFFERHRNLFALTNAGEQSRIVALLRQVLSEPERQAVSAFTTSVDQKFPLPRTIDEWWSIHQTAWFGEALEQDRFEIWFQPIWFQPTIDARANRGGESGFSHRIFAHECLIRLNAGRLYSGSEIVDAAHIRNEVHTFDSYARRLAIRSAARQLRPGKYFVNFTPSSVYNPEFCMRSMMTELKDSGMGPENIVFEVVESDHAGDSAHLRRICDYFRRHGFEFALDNVGSGSGSLKMLSDLRPDYIKLDRTLVKNVEQPVNAATVGKLVQMAQQFGTVVIACGVEREETMENLWLLGVQWMQGYLFGRPSPRLSHDLLSGDRLSGDRLSDDRLSGDPAPARNSYLPFPVIGAPREAHVSN